MDVWYALTDAPLARDREQRFRELLTPAERAQELRFLRPEHQRQYLVTRALVRTLLARYASTDPRTIAFACNAHGKPHVCQPEFCSWSFNLSHTSGIVVCAVDENSEMGIDVEPRDRRVEVEIADRYFAAPEVDALRRLENADQPRRFLDYWTLKEAFIKAIGTGLATPLADFAFRIHESREPEIDFLNPKLGVPSDWRFARFELCDRYVAALAQRRTGPIQFSVREMEWD